jgi:hypothetical protein
MYKFLRLWNQCTSVCWFLLSFSKNCCLSPYQSIIHKRLTCEGAEGLARPACIKRVPTPDVVLLECDIVQERAWHYYICSPVNTGCTFQKSRRYSRAIFPVMLLECDIVQEHVRHYYRCSPVNTGCTFHKSRRCSGTVFPVIIYVVREDAIPISICVIVIVDRVRKQFIKISKCYLFCFILKH